MSGHLSFGLIGAGWIGSRPVVTGHDARVALEIALAARESVETGAPVALNAVLR